MQEHIDGGDGEAGTQAAVTVRKSKKKAAVTVKAKSKSGEGDAGGTTSAAAE